MSRFADIRRLLGLTQAEMADVLGCVQSNVSFLDRGQTITPDVAAKLIGASRALSVEITFDHVYGNATLPIARHRPHRPGPSPRDWQALVADLTQQGLTPIEIAARIGVRLAVVQGLASGEMLDAPHAVGNALIALHGQRQKQEH